VFPLFASVPVFEVLKDAIYRDTPAKSIPENSDLSAPFALPNDKKIAEFHTFMIWHKVKCKGSFSRFPN